MRFNSPSSVHVHVNLFPSTLLDFASHFLISRLLIFIIELARAYHITVPSDESSRRQTTLDQTQTAPIRHHEAVKPILELSDRPLRQGPD